MTNGVDTLPDPPDAPDIQRRLALYGFQWIGLPVLLAIPLLALFGLFGERWQEISTRSGDLELSVRYPTAFRYKMLNSIDVDVRNRGDAAIDTITISLDTSYVDGFSTITAVPAFESAFELHLIDVAPNERRRARIEIQAERYWSHSGDLTIASRADTVRVPLTTMVYP